MKKNTRNIILAVVLLVVLMIIPFWPKLRQLLQPAEGPEISCTVQVSCEDLTLLPALRRGASSPPRSRCRRGPPCWGPWTRRPRRKA